MHINVSQLMKEPSGSVRFHEVDQALEVCAGHVDPVAHEEPAGPSGAKRLGNTNAHVSGQMKMLKTDTGVWVSAALKTEMSAVCSRCLKQFVQPLNATIDEEFFKQNGTEQNHNYTNESLAIDENNVLDLTETIRQYFSLSSPMKPLCRSECRGICSICGSNLNEDTCRCVHTQMDLRWEDLLSFVPSNYSAYSQKER